MRISALQHRTASDARTARAREDADARRIVEEAYADVDGAPHRRDHVPGQPSGAAGSPGDDDRVHQLEIVCNELKIRAQKHLDLLLVEQRKVQSLRKDKSKLQTENLVLKLQIAESSRAAAGSEPLGQSMPLMRAESARAEIKAALKAPLLDGNGQKAPPRAANALQPPLAVRIPQALTSPSRKRAADAVALSLSLPMTGIATADGAAANGAPAPTVTPTGGRLKDNSFGRPAAEATGAGARAASAAASEAANRERRQLAEEHLARTQAALDKAQARITLLQQQLAAAKAALPLETATIGDVPNATAKPVAPRKVKNTVGSDAASAASADARRLAVQHVLAGAVEAGADAAYKLRPGRAASKTAASGEQHRPDHHGVAKEASDVAPTEWQESWQAKTWMAGLKLHELLAGMLTAPLQTRLAELVAQPLADCSPTELTADQKAAAELAYLRHIGGSNVSDADRAQALEGLLRATPPEAAAVLASGVKDLEEKDLTPRELSVKFQMRNEFYLCDLKAFYDGLESAVGVPNPDLLDTMVSTRRRRPPLPPPHPPPLPPHFFA